MVFHIYSKNWFLFNGIKNHIQNDLNAICISHREVSAEKIIALDRAPPGNEERHILVVSDGLWRYLCANMNFQHIYIINESVHTLPPSEVLLSGKTGPADTKENQLIFSTYELKVLHYLWAGFSLQEISSIFNISYKTLHARTHKLMIRAGCSNRIQFQKVIVSIFKYQPIAEGGIHKMYPTI
ncbi:LuxR C-terminal-related transcriptional regulator [Apirhabdus apintestini]|uniref:LuxR C-terminal-related transcriptional regulator n=1 Tax=Erwinia sp. HR93 TaxID=3094840 RepID=UPI002ADEB69E|nr:LuxR C-terminal-related transcriptional regulator [Erwinia sp. HR93]MEA1063271.1 LuxR C-terminal-related transcriptional regulator [Erwinia sp. HR93]WPM85043.1 LuxR C-terminal-related transcriptional regulator [Enterobacteriaceae bacterium CA-0114]